MPRKHQRRARLGALGGVVVDDVEDHLDAGGVQRACTIALNSRDLLAAAPAAAYAACGAKKPTEL